MSKQQNNKKIIRMKKGCIKQKVRQDFNMNNPAASAAQLGVEILSPYRNSVGVQTATGLIGVCDVSCPALRLRLTRGYARLSPVGLLELQNN
jgi:hypothetical protein